MTNMLHRCTGEETGLCMLVWLLNKNRFSGRHLNFKMHALEVTDTHVRTQWQTHIGVQAWAQALSENFDSYPAPPPAAIAVRSWFHSACSLQNPHANVRGMLPRDLSHALLCACVCGFVMLPMRLPFACLPTLCMCVCVCFFEGMFPVSLLSELGPHLACTLRNHKSPGNMTRVVHWNADSNDPASKRVGQSLELRKCRSHDGGARRCIQAVALTMTQNLASCWSYANTLFDAVWQDHLTPCSLIQDEQTCQAWPSQMSGHMHNLRGCSIIGAHYCWCDAASLVGSSIRRRQHSQNNERDDVESQIRPPPAHACAHACTHVCLLCARVCVCVGRTGSTVTHLQEAQFNPCRHILWIISYDWNRPIIDRGHTHVQSCSKSNPQLPGCSHESKEAHVTEGNHGQHQ